MGAAASTGVAASIAASSADDLKTSLAGLDDETKAKLRKALEAPEKLESESMLPDVPLPSAVLMLEAIHSKKESCADVVAAALARIEATSDLKCCVDVLRDSAIAEAKKVDEKIAAGTPLRRLEGLPVVVKTNIEGPPGSLTSASTPALED